MKRSILLIFLLSIVMQSNYGQQKKISYGHNPAAGRYYDIRGIKMYAEIYGEGQPLLMIHGNGGDISAFSENIPYFARKYKVIAVDSRSQGRSVDLKDSLSFEMMADDFAALLDAMHIEKAFVLGWSDGGINALLLAMRNPGKVIKLASTGANLWNDSTVFKASDWKQGLDYYNKNKDKKWATAKEKNDWKMFALDWLQPNIALKDLSAIKCPSLIICGDRDLISIGHTELIYRNIPAAFMWVVPNSMHHTLIQHKDEFNKKVDEFFTQTSI